MWFSVFFTKKYKKKKAFNLKNKKELSRLSMSLRIVFKNSFQNHDNQRVLIFKNYINIQVTKRSQ